MTPPAPTRRSPGSSSVTACSISAAPRSAASGGSLCRLPEHAGRMGFKGDLMERATQAAACAALACFAHSALASPAVTLTDANTQSNPLTYQAGPYVVGTSNVGC